MKQHYLSIVRLLTYSLRVVVKLVSHGHHHDCLEFKIAVKLNSFREDARGFQSMSAIVGNIDYLGLVQQLIRGSTKAKNLVFHNYLKRIEQAKVWSVPVLIRRLMKTVTLKGRNQRTLIRRNVASGATAARTDSTAVP